MLIDTHAHLYDEAFADDLEVTIGRAKTAGISKIFLPAIDLPSVTEVLRLSQTYKDYCYPMIGLQPEEVHADYAEVLLHMETILAQESFIGIGEVGLDFYWTREFEKEQLVAFERQVEWAVQYHLPLMIHCRRAQNELLHILKHYKDELVGGVFHCFTGNPTEAEHYLEYERFCLGIGGVLTFKSSHLRTDLPQSVPLNRIVLETDSPYLAPTPYRGKRNESSYVSEVAHCLAESYGCSDEEVAKTTTENALRVFPLASS